MAQAKSGTQSEARAALNLGWLTRLIFETPRAVFIGAVLTLLVMKVGISPIPNFGVAEAIARDPFHYGFESDGFYQMWNWLTPYLAWVLHLNTGSRFLALHLFFAIGFLLIVIVQLFRTLPDAQARTATIIFMAMPVSGSVLYWICYDAPALFLMALALFVFTNKYLLVVLGFLLGMQDFEPTVVAFTGLALAVFIDKSPGYQSHLWRAGSVISGAILGRIVLTVLFARWDLQASTGRLAWFQRHLPEMKDQVLQSPGLCLWAVLGVAWVVLALCVLADVKNSRGLVVSLVFLSVLVFTTADKTRVMALATFPLLSVMWLRNSEVLDKFNKKMVTVLTLVWLVTPWIFIWQQSMYTSTFFGSSQGFQGTWQTLRAIFGL